MARNESPVGHQLLVFHVIDDLVGDGLQAAELALRQADISGRPRNHPFQQLHPLLAAAQV
jgi:hypothetical protein